MRDESLENQIGAENTNSENRHNASLAAVAVWLFVDAQFSTLEW